MEAWCVEIENSFCQTQNIYFKSEGEALRAAAHIRYSDGDKYTVTVYESNVPEVITIDEFLEYNK